MESITRCLVNAVNVREFCKRLEADLAAGRNEQECRGMVKAVLRGLTLQESVKDAVLYLPRGGKRQVCPIPIFLEKQNLSAVYVQRANNC